jgi:hypothetical protein
MSRRGGSIYVSTNPTNIVYGVPGVGTSIGLLGTDIFYGDAQNTPYVQQPVSGATINFAANPDGMFAVYTIGQNTPNATLAALTFTFTNGWITSPGQRIYINIVPIVTAITLSGANVSGTLTGTTLPNTVAAFEWRGTQWVEFI